ncbi:ABC transporter ATP-binding protein [Acaryochloris marina]|uniref:ABC transporter, ATP-binding protein n=1 Tax=Acaryochloris marina (strain MBIC 11017) TaxID=329726 RepID=B0CF39_ACAM1|nr:ABC transporter ATP-binding protein [Acaryochloris marina]ABW30555.1 ABC transporter, ATP-binding protein [Acaryochloris marina MBIC11017]BDM79357.1 ABC transporter ATP-binding protein [Acaryochloris marina MBIC10699]
MNSEPKVTPTSDNPSSPEQAEQQPIIQTFSLRKTYRTGFWMNKTVTSLQQCSVQVMAGETFGLLGPNGAGKTTLLKILLGLAKPSAGRGFLLGKPLGDRSAKQHIGYLPENAYFYDYLTGWEFLKYAAGLFQIPEKVQKRRIPELLDMVGLDRKTAKKKQMRRYSKGMLQRVGMAQALINDPKLVFLDEPMSGLDPMGRYQMREIILSLKEQGKTVFFNSHVLSDVEVICDRVAILALGELICEGTLDQLLGANTQNYQVKGRGGNSEVLSKVLIDFEMQAEQWHGQLQGDPQTFISKLDSMGGTLVEMKLMRQSLEDFFIQQLRQRGIQKSR